jgi:hypothetical protein
VGLINAASSFVTWPLYVVAVALFFGIWFAKFQSWRKSQRDGSFNAGAPASGQGGLVYTEAPTVRVGDSQRMERLHRVITLNAGQHVDVLDVAFERIPRLRIALSAIETDAADRRDYARLQIELGGALAGCGSQVKQLGPNEFLAPLASREEQPYSILHFAGQGEALSFLRIKVIRLDVATNSADVDVLHLSGRWTS